MCGLEQVEDKALSRQHSLRPEKENQKHKVVLSPVFTSYHSGRGNAVRELILDGAGWKTRDDVYDAFFGAVGAPNWHGRNLDAVADGISGGSINNWKCRIG